MKNLNVTSALVLVTAIMLSACGEKNPVITNEPSTAGASSTTTPGFTAGNPMLDPLLNNGAGGPANGGAAGGLLNPPTGTSNLSGVDLQIKNAYQQYLPNCYNASRASFWKDFLGRGGQMAEMIASLKIVSTGTTCNANGQETTTDPHYIRGYYEFYLPGCYDSTKQTFWQDWFGRGGSDADFRITLANVAVSSPRPTCLR